MQDLECVCFYSEQGETTRMVAHCKDGSPTVGALGDAAMDENRRAINLYF
jgi:hypothetical protein